MGKYGVCRRGCAGTRRVESKRVETRRGCAKTRGGGSREGFFRWDFISFRWDFISFRVRRRDDANRGLTNMFF